MQLVYDWIQQYQIKGDALLRQGRGQLLVEATLQGQMSGVDTMRQTRMCFDEMASIMRLRNELSSLVVGMRLRLFGILFVIFCVRIFLLQSVDDLLWTDWILVDRMAISAMVIIFGCAVYVLFHYQKSACISQFTESFFVNWYRDYIRLSPEGGGDQILACQLREVRMAEISEGVDRVPLAQRFYNQALSNAGLLIKQHLERWPTIIVVLEMVTFLIGSMGMIVIPGVAWLENASSRS